METEGEEERVERDGGERERDVKFGNIKGGGRKFLGHFMHHFRSQILPSSFIRRDVKSGAI